MVGSEKIASFMMGEVKPTASGVSKGGNLEATRDSAWRIERSSGREDYRQIDTGGQVVEGEYSSIMNPHKTFFEVWKTG